MTDEELERNPIEGALRAIENGRRERKSYRLGGPDHDILRSQLEIDAVKGRLICKRHDAIGRFQQNRRQMSQGGAERAIDFLWAINTLRLIYRHLKTLYACAMFTAVQLQTFVDAAESGSFAATAAKRGVSPGAISNGIKYLETKLGAELFFRDGLKIRLTRAGEIFLPHAKGILKKTDSAIKAVHELRSHAKK